MLLSGFALKIDSEMVVETGLTILMQNRAIIKSTNLSFLAWRPQSISN
jgi:hypothetical protein